MRTVLNILWLVLSGLWLALGYLFVGVLLCVLIITIPFGIACFRLAAFVLWPFGRAVVPNPEAGAPSTVANVLWFVLAGLWMALAHLVLGVDSAVAAFLSSMLRVIGGASHRVIGRAAPWGGGQASWPGPCCLPAGPAEAPGQA